MYNTPSWEEYTNTSQQNAGQQTLHIDIEKVITDDFCAKHGVSMKYDTLGGFSLCYDVENLLVIIASYTDCKNEPIRIASSFRLNAYHNKYHRYRHTFDIVSIYKKPSEFIMNSDGKAIKQLKWKNELNFHTNPDNLTTEEFSDELGKRIDWSISILKKKLPILKEKHGWIYNDYINSLTDDACISHLTFNDLMKSETGTLENHNTYRTYILNTYEMPKPDKGSRWIMFVNNHKTNKETMWIVNCLNGNCTVNNRHCFNKEDIDTLKIILENM